MSSPFEIAELGSAIGEEGAAIGAKLLSDTGLPAIDKTHVLAIRSENIMEGVSTLFSRICGHAGETLGRFHFIDAGSAQTVDALVERISRSSGGRPLRDVAIESHGNQNGKIILWGPQPIYWLADSSTQRAFKSLNMTSDSRLTFLGCRMAIGPHGAENLQRFADSTGIRTRAFQGIQWTGTQGFGPYLEAIPGQTEQLKGFRCHWDALLFPAGLAVSYPVLYWSIDGAKRALSH